MAYPAELRLQQIEYSCPHFSMPVRVESHVTYPSDFFQEQPQRILQRTCSAEFDCVLLDKAACPMRLLQIRLQTLQ